MDEEREVGQLCPHTLAHLIGCEKLTHRESRLARQVFDANRIDPFTRSTAERTVTYERGKLSVRKRAIGVTFVYSEEEFTRYADFLRNGEIEPYEDRERYA